MRNGISATRGELAPAPRLRHGIEPHRIEFTGSGREYFRVWIVNVLLMLLTLGFYTPWARRRTAQYFYGHTHVAGSPLEFTAQQRKMVFGFLAFVALSGAYQLATRSGQQTAATLMFFGFALLAPFLWASAMRFRLSATRWRGIRPVFAPRWREVYLVSWPVFAIAALWTGVFFAASALAPEMPQGTAGPRVSPLPKPGPEFWALTGTGALLTFLCVIRLQFNYRRLLVARTRVGGQAGRWKPVYSDFVKVWLRTALFYVLCVAVVSGAAIGLGLLLDWFKWGRTPGLRGMIMMVIVFMVASFLMFFVITVPAIAYFQARMFQLVWSNIGVGQVARFKTDLKTAPFVWLRTKNAVLTLFTIGLWRPFARASEYAAKVQSVTLHVKGGVDQLVGELVEQQGALGDAVADALGLDVIG